MKTLEFYKKFLKMSNLEQLNREEANNYILNDFNLQNYQNIEVKLINIIAEKIRYFFFEKVNEYDQVIGQVKQVESVKDVIYRMVNEYLDSIDRLNSLLPED